MAYTTIDDVSLYLRTTFDGSSTPTDVQVQAYIDEIDEVVNQITGRVWESTTFTEEYDIEAYTDRLLLNEYPVISVTSVEVNTGDIFNKTWSAVTAVLKDNFIIFENCQAPAEAAIRVVYNAGYAAVPTDIKELATLLVVKKIVFGDATAKSGTSSLSIGSLSITKNVGLSRISNIDAEIDTIIQRLGGYRVYIS